MSNEMFNMVKAVVGVGVLSLPAGKSFVHIHIVHNKSKKRNIILCMSMINERTPDVRRPRRRNAPVSLAHFASNYTR